MHAEKPALIINPKAGPIWRRRKARRLIRCLGELFPALSVHFTQGPGDGRTLAHRLTAEGSDLILAAGGDGTYHEVINGMAGSAVPLGILPMGTGNSLVRELGLSSSPFQAAVQIREGSARSVFLGRMDGRHFILMVGAGFDADVIQSVSPRGKRFGMAAYVLAGIVRLFRYRYPEIPFQIDGREVRGTCGVIAKGRSYGGPFMIAPDARLDQPEFIVVVMKGRGPLTYLKYTLGIMAGIHFRIRGLEYFAARNIEIPVPVPLQVDGEGAGRAPLRATIESKPFPMVFPPARN